MKISHKYRYFIELCKLQNDFFVRNLRIRHGISAICANLQNATSIPPHTRLSIRYLLFPVRLCSGTVAGQDIGQGISTLRYRYRICRSRLKVQVFTNPHKIFLFFTFFFFLRCLSGYLFFAENHIKFWIIIRNSKKFCTFKKVMYLCSPIPEVPYYLGYGRDGKYSGCGAVG